MRQLAFKRHRFPADIIRHSIWLRARFTLSYRDVEEMLAERGLDVSYETVRRWFLKFGSSIAANLRRARVDEEAAREAGLRTKPGGCRPASVLRVGLPSYRPRGRTRSRSESQQQGREFAATGSPARTQTTKVQVTRLRATFPLHPLPQPTILSTTSVTSSNDRCSRNFEPHRSRFGKAPASRPDLGSELAKL